MKSIGISKILAQFLNLGHLETIKSNFEKFCHSRPKQSKLEKGSLAVHEGASHCEMARK